MSRRAKATAMILALQLMLRVWRLSRKTGIPFNPLLQAHLEVMRLKIELLTQAAHEQRVAEIARNN